MRQCEGKSTSPLSVCQLAAQEREQARLARAVGADQPDAFAGIETEVSALEERLRAARECDLGEADQAPAILPIG